MKDFYLVLQVARSATPKEIRSAYRRRALELHPDQSGAGSEPFIELQKAYGVLRDSRKRAAYDRQTGTIPIRRVVGSEKVRRPRAEPFRDVEPMSGSGHEELLEWLWSDVEFGPRLKRSSRLGRAITIGRGRLSRRLGNCIFGNFAWAW
jgi:DnaJ-class molecular chaperone